MASKRTTKSRARRETEAEYSDRISKALGASVVIPLGNPGGPMGLLGLSTFFLSRLVSRGGRPSDPSWTVRRLVPFSSETWRRLSAEARRLSTPSRRLTPAQLVAILIERHLGSERT